MVRTRLLVVLAIAVSSGGCASASGPTLANRFIRQGTPAVDLGGPRPRISRVEKGSPSLERASVRNGVSRMSSALSSVESTDPALRDALFRVAVAPTAAHHLEVARAYRKVGIMDAAYDYLTASLAVNGPDPAVHDALARLWRDWGYPGLGLSDAYHAVHQAPDWAAAHNTLGTLLYKLGQRDAARLRFEEAARLDPGAAYAFDNLCRLSMAAGNTREAIGQCRQADAIRAGRHPRKAREERR